MTGPTTRTVGSAVARRSTPVALPVEPVGLSTTPARTE
jgi:hypothetical protein